MAGTYEPISTVTTTGTPSTIDFTSIPQTYTDLVLVFVNTGVAGVVGVRTRFNNDSSAIYDKMLVYGQNSSVNRAQQSNQTYYNAIASGLHEFAESWINISGYSNTNTFTTLLSRLTGTGDASNSWSTRDTRSWFDTGRWRSTAAVTSINLSPESGNFAVGTIVTLFGIKKA
jgi:hypothetical protein